MKTREIEIVEMIRDMFPDMAQRTLARKIYYRRFPDPSTSLSYSMEVMAPVATIYGRIRRYDKARWNAVPAAV